MLIGFLWMKKRGYNYQLSLFAGSSVRARRARHSGATAASRSSDVCLRPDRGQTHAANLPNMYMYSATKHTAAAVYGYQEQGGGMFTSCLCCAGEVVKCFSPIWSYRNREGYCICTRMDVMKQQTISQR